jgi:hypothetical protein
MRLGEGRYLAAGERPGTTVTSVHELTTADGATVRGVLATVPGARTVVCLMHPRQDVTHHALVPLLLQAGAAVWTQGSRSPNNDLNLVHEQALLDVAAGQVFLRERFDDVVVLGHSGGGPLFAYYLEQAAAFDRIGATPGGRPVDLAGAEMPVADGAIFLAPHPGQGKLLLACIDPSVADESDPMSVIPELDPWNPANGFAQPPASSSYSPDFLAEYRAAQRARVEQLDAFARESLAATAAARKTHEVTGAAVDRRRALAPTIMTVFRTDADPRTVDLSLDPSDRPYGSLFGRRPDLIDYGQVGFGRLATPEAWLSTWSGLSSYADFVRCAPGVTVPTLFLELTGDQAAFPADSARMIAALGTAPIPGGDLTAAKVRGLHFGAALAPGEPTGNELAAAEIATWLAKRFPLAGP